MEERKLSVLDVLKVNVNILSGIRIPISEKQIWEAVNGVMQNEIACIQAMEAQENKASEEENMDTETEEQDNV